jgi:splicing factor 3B subunit 3
LLTSSFSPLDEFDSYIIVSFVNATLVLSIGETVEEVTDSGFLGTTPTLSCSALGDDALVQVHIGIDRIQSTSENWQH